MATRFRLTNDDTDPAVTPAHQTYTHTRTGTPEYRRLLTTDTSVLTTTAYTPDAADDLTAGDALHSTFVSDPMPAGVAFNNGQTIKMAIQGLEPNAANNVSWQMWVGIYDSAGTTLQRTIRSKVAEGLELGGSLAARFLSTTQDGANYTTVANDRIVVEVSVTGTPTAAGGVNGHNASLRFGGDGASGDLPESDGSTSTTLNPWIEFTPTFSFGQTVSVAQTTETDLAQAVTPLRVKASAQANETSLAQTIRAVRVRAIAQPLETDLAQPITAALTGGQDISVGQVGESDEAQLVRPAELHEAAQALETDEATQVTWSRAVTVVQANESDEALPLGVSIELGQATETDTAQDMDFFEGAAGTGIVRSPNRVRISVRHNEVT